MSVPSAKRAEIAARRAKAVSLRLAGASLDVIMETLEYSSRAAVSKDISRAMDAALKEQHAKAEELRALEIARLDRLQRGLWPAALAGDVKSTEAVLKLIVQRCKLLGLDTPPPRNSDAGRSILGDLAAGLQLAHAALIGGDTYQPPAADAAPAD